MARLFGTDGVRGLANRDITAELAVDLAVAAAHVLAERGEFSGHRPRAIIGRDTRISGQFLGAAVAAGLASAGVDVHDVGVLPTPGIAFLTGWAEADLGVVLSASHNPAPDNGIKFFARGGHKLDDAVEEAIEARLGELWERPTGANVGAIVDASHLASEYVKHVVSAVASFAGIDRPLAGVSIVVDAGHGAASTVGPQALAEAGATVYAINVQPNGLNINDGVGSTHLDGLRAEVVARGADLGVAYDGDADRCLAVDHTGAVVNGDQIMGMLAVAMQRSGTLYHGTLVATVMSNLGLQLAMRDADITIIESAVGDRYVLEAMREGGYTLGGEQSGHVILSDYATTGDGVLTSLVLGAQVAAHGPLADLAASIRSLPQVLINVADCDRSRVHTDIVLNDAVAKARTELGDGGRVLLRPSGTEALVRVMVEATTVEDAQRHADVLAAVVQERLGFMTWWDWILHFSSHVEELVNNATESAWIYLWVFAMALIDGVIPIVPSETIVIATASTWTHEKGVPWLLGIWLAAAAGAWCGDQLTYQIGTKIHIRSVRLFRGPRGQRTLDWAEHALIHRGAAFIIAARFIPFGRVAVNLTAGALKFNRRRFMFLDAIAAVIWATWSVAIGLGAAAIFKDNQLLAIVAGVAGGLVLGWAVDRLLARFGVKVPDATRESAPTGTDAAVTEATTSDSAVSESTASESTASDADA